MAKARPRPGHPRTMRLRPASSIPATAQAVDAPLSLPLAECPAESPTEPGDDKGPASPSPLQHWLKPPDSKIRTKVMTILAMRVAGMEDEQISKELNLGLGTIRNYIYLAGRNGWLNADMLQTPVETVEYTLLHKVVRNLDQYLDSPIPSERQAVTEKLFDATMARHWAPVVATGPAQTLVAIRIIQPEGPIQAIREGTIGGKSAWLDGEVSND